MGGSSLSAKYELGRAVYVKRGAHMKGHEKKGNSGKFKTTGAKKRVQQLQAAKLELVEATVYNSYSI